MSEPSKTPETDLAHERHLWDNPALSCEYFAILHHAGNLEIQRNKAREEAVDFRNKWAAIKARGGKEFEHLFVSNMFEWEEPEGES